VNSEIAHATAYRLRHLTRLQRRSDEEAAGHLFRTVRFRLSLWYSGILAVILLISSLVLYLSVRHSLLTPIDQGLQQNAQVLSQTWVTELESLPSLSSEWSPCSTDHLAPPDSLDVCYDSQGRVLGASHLVADVAPSLAVPSLVPIALRNGRAEDTMQVASFPGGSIQRYAVKVIAPRGQVVGVVQVGASVGEQLQALDTLLHLLLLLGFLTLILSGLCGLFLANRALLPARLAHDRQRDFISDASHELRTPLTMLRSNVEVVLRGKDRLPADDVALLEDTVQEAAHLASIANSMLDLARLDNESAHLEEEVVDLGQLSGDLARWASSLAVEHDLAIRAGVVGPVMVVGDRLLLRQALLILIDNAIKYNKPGGEVLVEVTLRHHEARVDVRDTGIGIAASEMSRLGERFYRVDKARSRETGGAGLGLSIVRRIAERHHGSFHLTSDPDHGTTATLMLPAVESSDAHHAG
jgi:signal transduction histidine kinase